MTAVIPEIVNGVVCVFWAYANAQAIKANEWILHGVNGALHLTAILYFGIKIHWIVGLVMLLEARILFDIPLNLFRGLKIGYVPENPKSLLDMAEKKVFGNDGLLPKVVYSVLLYVVLFIQSKVLL